MRGGKTVEISRSSNICQVPIFDEAIRTVVLSLKQSNGGKLPSSLVVTSAHSGEGKSLVARSLAIELAAAAIPVLLVDGDLRRGNLEFVFQVRS